MKAFRIKQLRVSGVGKIDGFIEFNDGLNVIQGRSNTGKTWILKCIYYLFGTDTNPFSPLTGYSVIEGVFKTERYGEITIRRELDNKKAEVITNNAEVENGYYDTSYQGKGPLYLNDLWLRVFSIDHEVLIPTSARYSRERLSWRNVASVFFVDEDEIDKSQSIVLKNPTYDTSIISSLIYFLTGDSKEGIEEILKPEVATKAKEAVVRYIDDQVKSLTDMKSNYILQLEELAGSDIDAQMQKITDTVEEIQQQLDELILESSSVTNQVSELQQKNANCKVLIDRYESLKSQYKADLQRLDFIAKGAVAVESLPENKVCPFCGGKVENHNEDYHEAIEAETRRIVSEIAIIMATENTVKEEQEKIAKDIRDLNEKRSCISIEISTKNTEISAYKTDLKKYKDYTKIQSGIEFVNHQLEILGEKKINAEKKKKNHPLYSAKKDFESHINDEFDKRLNIILKECNYRAGYASWDFKSFDILMNGISKEVDQGKGYRSFLNSVVAMMLYEYFNEEKSYIKPGFLMIDTPLLGFDEDEDKGETLKIGLYQYFINHQDDGQMIVVDNLNVIPNIDFEAAGVKVTTYYKNEDNGHVYGFLPSWRKDLPEETR